jgi:hypothetical protein
MSAFIKQEILGEIAAIESMERGKLSAYSFKERADAGTYYKLQRWQDGKNVTRYVPTDEVAAVKAALDGYDQFRQLTERYAQVVIDETRQNIASKKKTPSRRGSSWPRTRKSNG